MANTPRQRTANGSSTTNKLVGSFMSNGSDQRSASSSSNIEEYSRVLDNNDDNTGDTSSSQGEGGREKRKVKVRQISLLGERNSGTRWTYAHLNECFNHSIPVERRLTRYKHWFQYQNETQYPHDTLVIAQFRNPYDWLKAMQRVPHHSPSHLKKNWSDFLTIPWTAPRLGEDIEMGNNITAENNSTGTTPCQENFIYQDIVSCVRRPLPESAYDHKLRFSEDTPIYEMRPESGGQPFKSVMDMRSAKIQNFLDVQNYPGVASVWAVQYEFLLQRGTEHLIERIAEWTGIEPKCNAYPPQLRRERPFEPEFVEYVTQHLNWSAEGLIGYGKYKQRVGPPKEEETEAS